MQGVCDAQCPPVQFRSEHAALASVLDTTVMRNGDCSFLLLPRMLLHRSQQERPDQQGQVDWQI